MKNVCKVIVTMLFACFFHAAALAADAKGSADEAVAMVKKAVVYLKENGKEKAFAEFANPDNKDFHHLDLYVFVYDFNGIAVAHGNNPKMVGKNLLDMKDIDGVFIIKSFIDLARTKGSGWVDYKWPNPVTKAVQQKSSYIEKAGGDLIVGVGIYK